MIELTRHIEILLLENDCVIVPELGGFITHHQPAHYEEDEGVYLPPSRTVAFNPQLTMNDGLLVQSFMQAYHLDYTDALKMMNEEVDQLKKMLYQEGIVDMEGIGKLHCNIYGTYEFQPNANGILAPSLYALDTFPITMLPTVSAIIPETEDAVSPVYPTEEKKKIIRLNPHWLSNAVAVAVAVILFFVLSIPVENTYVDKGNYASLGTDCLFDAIRSQSMATVVMATQEESAQKPVVTPVAVKVEKVTASPTKVTKKEEPKVVKKEAKDTKTAPKAPKMESKKATAVQSKSNSKKYHLIVASLTTQEDAQRMLKTYHKQGYTEAKVLGSNGRFRISLCNYAEQATATRKLNDLKQKDAFKNAWMLTSK